MKQSVISIISPAGGVGKSTISKELACIYGSTAIDGKKLRVCLVDANLSFGCQRALLNVPFTQYDLSTWLSDHRRLIGQMDYSLIEDRYTWDYMQRYMTYISDYGIYLITAPEECYTDIDMSVTEANTLIRSLKKLFDIIIIDTPNDMSSITVSAIDLASNVYFVINDDQRSLCKMLALRSALVKNQMIANVSAKSSLIFNKYTKSRKHRFVTPDTAEDILQFPVSMTIPYFPDAVYYNNRCRSLALSNTSLSEPLFALAKQIVPEVDTSHLKAPLFSRIFRKNKD